MFLATFFSNNVLFYCRNSTLPLFKKDLFVGNGYFSATRSISIVMKQASFSLFDWDAYQGEEEAEAGRRALMSNLCLTVPGSSNLDF